MGSEAPTLPAADINYEKGPTFTLEQQTILS